MQRVDAEEDRIVVHSLCKGPRRQGRRIDHLKSAEAAAHDRAPLSAGRVCTSPFTLGPEQSSDNLISLCVVPEIRASTSLSGRIVAREIRIQRLLTEANLVGGRWTMDLDLNPAHFGRSGTAEPPTHWFDGHLKTVEGFHESSILPRRADFAESRSFALVVLRESSVALPAAE